jgi:hypothetical protein
MKFTFRPLILAKLNLTTTRAKQLHGHAMGLKDYIRRKDFSFHLAIFEIVKSSYFYIFSKFVKFREL